MKFLDVGKVEFNFRSPFALNGSQFHAVLRDFLLDFSFFFGHIEGVLILIALGIVCNAQASVDFDYGYIGIWILDRNDHSSTESYGTRER